MNIDPELPLDILRDHEASVELVHGYIRERRSLSPDRPDRRQSAHPAGGQ